MPLTLLVPDLLPPADAPPAMREVRLRALEKGLARADITRLPGREALTWLAEAAGLPAPAPYAAIALAGDDAPREGVWMRADPVHLRIDRDLVALHDASNLDVGPEEAQVLVAALQALFRDDGLAFVAPVPDRWYVRVPPGAVPETTPLHAAAGRDIFGLLPRGGAPLNWRSMMTEAQMVLSGHEASARREAAGLPAINSVWFWGEGAAPARVTLPFDTVVANESFARGLAKLAGATHVPLPAALSGLDALKGEAEALVVLDDLTRPFRRGDIEAWLAAARCLDERWFGPAQDAASRFGTLRLVLPGEGGTVVAALKPSSRWRLLRPRKPISFHA
jgi:hypothetical protein